MQKNVPKRLFSAYQEQIEASGAIWNIDNRACIIDENLASSYIKLEYRKPGLKFT